MDWMAILIIECVGFPMCAIPTIFTLFARYNAYYANYYLYNSHYDNEKILKVWQFILICIGSILPIVNIILGLCLIVNVIVNFGLGVYKWNNSTKIYNFLTKKI